MGWEQFSGVNAAHVLDLYERYRRDPSSVDAATREAFLAWGPPDAAPSPLPAASVAPAAPATTRSDDLGVVVGAANLVESIRRYGHLAAQVDPLG